MDKDEKGISRRYMAPRHEEWQDGYSLAMKDVMETGIRYRKLKLDDGQRKAVDEMLIRARAYALEVNAAYLRGSSDAPGFLRPYVLQKPTAERMEGSVC